jgi:hypothetical protein
MIQKTYPGSTTANTAKMVKNSRKLPHAHHGGLWIRRKRALRSETGNGISPDVWYMKKIEDVLDTKS